MNLPADPNELPPPTAVEVEARLAETQQQQPVKAKTSPVKVIGIVAASLIGFGLMAAAGSSADKDDDSGRKMTLTEAACKLLREGDDPELVYAVMKDLAADHPLQLGEDEAFAARVAVDRAQIQGC